MSYGLLVFDPSIGRLRRLKNILITTVTFDTTNSKTITIPAGVSPKVYAEVTGLYYLTYTYDSSTGNLTLTIYRYAVSTTSATVLSDVTASTASVVSSVSASTATITTISTTSSVSVVTGISKTTTSVVSSVGDDVGKWTVGADGLASHTHNVSTATVVSDVTASTTSVTTVSVTTRTVVTGVSVTTTSVVTGLTKTTTSVVQSASLVGQAPSSGEYPITVEVIVMW
jgi:hypothetical protein